MRLRILLLLLLVLVIFFILIIVIVLVLAPAVPPELARAPNVLSTVSDWFTTARSSAFRFVRMDGARSVLVRPGASPLISAAAFAILFTLVVLSLLIIIPLLIVGGIVFLVSFAALKIRALLTRATHLLPRHDGRRNVRVRLPSETPE